MIKLVHGKKCPQCGQEFDTTGHLIPNTKDKEFYGGRVHYFKEVRCNCGIEYLLLIEKKYDAIEGMKYTVIDMADITKKNPFKTYEGVIPFKNETDAKENTPEEPKPIDTTPHVLTTVMSKEEQVQRLELCTLHELQTLCKLHKVKQGRGDSKYKIIERLLAAVPNLVVPNPKNG